MPLILLSILALVAGAYYAGDSFGIFKAKSPAPDNTPSAGPEPDFIQTVSNCAPPDVFSSNAAFPNFSTLNYKVKKFENDEVKQLKKIYNMYSIQGESWWNDQDPNAENDFKKHHLRLCKTILAAQGVDTKLLDDFFKVYLGYVVIGLQVAITVISGGTTAAATVPGIIGGVIGEIKAAKTFVEKQTALNKFIREMSKPDTMNKVFFCFTNRTKK